MIIVSRNPLSAPDRATLVHLGENGLGYVYKTDNIESVKAANPEANILEVSANEQKTLRKTLLSAQQIDIETQNKIRAKYSLEAELAALRTGDEDYRAFIEEIIAEHNAAKNALFSV